MIELGITIVLGICGALTVLVSSQQLAQKHYFNFIACFASGAYAIGRLIQVTLS